MKFLMERHTDTGLFYWVAEGNDKLVNHEFISFQGYITRIVGDLGPNPYIEMPAGTNISFRTYKSIHQHASTKPVLVEFYPVWIDEIHPKKQYVLNSLNSKPRLLDDFFAEAEAASQKAMMILNKPVPKNPTGC